MQQFEIQFSRYYLLLYPYWDASSVFNEISSIYNGFHMNYCQKGFQDFNLNDKHDVILYYSLYWFADFVQPTSIKYLVLDKRTVRFCKSTLRKVCFEYFFKSNRYLFLHVKNPDYNSR